MRKNHHLSKSYAYKFFNLTQHVHKNIDIHNKCILQVIDFIRINITVSKCIKLIETLKTDK